MSDNIIVKQLFDMLDKSRSAYLQTASMLARSEFVTLEARIAELEALTTWQPIETAPDNIKVLLLIQIINGYNIVVAIRSYCGEIGDQWSTDGGSYFHGTSLKMLVGWMPLPKPPEDVK
jgi:hypothetical protein